MSIEEQHFETKVQDFSIKAGFDDIFTDVVLNWNSTTEAYEAADITSATISMPIVDNEGTTFLTKATGGSGITITDAANGEYEIEFTDADTTTSDRGVYTYSIELTLSTGEKKEILKGVLTIV